VTVDGGSRIPVVRQLTLNQAVVLVIVAAFLPIGLLGFLQGISSREYTTSLIRERLVSSALLTAAAQREPFAAAQTTLRLLAENADVRNVASKRCSAVLAEMMSQQKAIINLARSSADGVLRCSALPSKQIISNKNTDWWRKGEAAGRFTVSPLVMGKITRRPVFVAMLPVFGADGKFDGAVTAAIDASWFEAALREKKLSSDSVVGIVDETGRVLVRNASWNVGRINVRSAVGESETLIDNDGGHWLYASAPLFGQQLHVVYAEPEAPLLSPLQNQLRVNLLLPIVAILATCVAIWFALNRFVIRWLRELGGMARQFARGGYTYDPARFSDAPREIAQLGEDLGNMASAIEERDAVLRKSAADNRAMAREVNHRVKNNLQMVMSLLELQSVQLRDEESRSAVDQTRLRMSVIALVHRILYEFGDNGERGEVDLDRLITELVSQIRNANPGQVKLSCSARVGQMSVDLAMPICLFLVEAVTNAYRHAFSAPAWGQISVSVIGDSRAGLIRVTDDGLGRVDQNAVNAMSWQLMQAYASQLNGKVEVASSDGNGTVVKLAYKSH